MEDTLNLEVTTNVNQFPYEKKFPSTIPLRELKKKLELVVGTSGDLMKIEVFDSEGNFVATLSDDSKSIAELGVRNGMRIHATDITGQNLELNNGDMVEKYNISDEAYNNRTDSVRALKKKMMAEKAQEEGNTQAIDPNQLAAANMKVGDRCEVRVKGNMERRGIIAFVGPTEFQSGYWVGVRYDEPVGKNNGSVAGVRYFACDDKYGGFVRPVDVHVGDFPELELEMDEL
ncbi:unnamed protein product, partial [Mesorhabditis belari]|uniref:CAP-Gly domain-containing protein n=1 Tax=Mesorhabditis belari TaxID=2138241 RepID=A0AAF3E8M8_9BILA